MDRYSSKIVAQTKNNIRVRSRFKQSNALWTQDGDELLQEGNNELTNLRETLINDQINIRLRRLIKWRKRNYMK